MRTRIGNQTSTAPCENTSVPPVLHLTCLLVKHTSVLHVLLLTCLLSEHTPVLHVLLLTCFLFTTQGVLAQLGWDKQRLAEESANPVLLISEADRPGTAPTKYLRSGFCATSR